MKSTVLVLLSIVPAALAQGELEGELWAGEHAIALIVAPGQTAALTGADDMCDALRALAARRVKVLRSTPSTR